MRTIRNVTFVILCAMVYLMPATAQASDSSCVGPNYLWSSGGVDYYSANCGPGSCPYAAYDLAFNTCGGTMVEFFCDDATGMFTFGCYPIIWD